MHPKIASGTVAIYARYSSELQSEASIEDQIRRARDVIARAGGDPDRAMVFPDYAMSGASMVRPGLEALLRAVDEKKVDVILTEDISRISRDMADAAQIFKRLQFAGVPLIGISDGIDTSAKHAKLNFAVKSLLADMYLDELRDKTLRGLEGRALAGFATGQVPLGYKTVASDRNERIAGRKIVIDEKGAKVVRRIFEEYRDGGSLLGIAQTLNAEGVPSPRAGSRHKRFGWGPSTIRTILYNESYVGVWRFKETQWVKVPGTNRRQPRRRPADEVMTMERPELRIIDADLWSEVSTRLAAVHRKWTKNSSERVEGPWRSNYLLSGILVCDECGFPLNLYGGQSTRYYRCNNNVAKKTCGNDLRVREEILRKDCIEAIREQIQSPEGIAYVRKQMAMMLRDYSKSMDAELKERRERLERTEGRIKGLVVFIADGDRSEYVVTTMRDLEAQAKAERAEIDRIHREAQEPLRLPSIDEITRGVFELDRLLDVPTRAPRPARMQLRRWLKDGEVRVARTETGYEIRGALLPLAACVKNENAQLSSTVGHTQSNSSSGGEI